MKYCEYWKIDNYINDKLKNDDNFIKFRFFEVRVTLEICEKDVNIFLCKAKKVIEDEGYNMYFTGAKYTYCGIRKQVEDNEMIIAIKE